MVEWTCCECEGKYVDGVSGDADERMCYNCLDKEEENEGKSMVELDEEYYKREKEHLRIEEEEDGNNDSTR